MEHQQPQQQQQQPPASTAEQQRSRSPLTKTSSPTHFTFDTRRLDAAKAAAEREADESRDVIGTSPIFSPTTTALAISSSLPASADSSAQVFAPVGMRLMLSTQFSSVETSQLPPFTPSSSLSLLSLTSPSVNTTRFTSSKTEESARSADDEHEASPSPSVVSTVEPSPTSTRRESLVSSSSASTINRPRHVHTLSGSSSASLSSVQPPSEIWSPLSASVSGSTIVSPEISLSSTRRSSVTTIETSLSTQPSTTSSSGPAFTAPSRSLSSPVASPHDDDDDEPDAEFTVLDDDEDTKSAMSSTSSSSRSSAIRRACRDRDRISHSSNAGVVAHLSAIECGSVDASGERIYYEDSAYFGKRVEIYTAVNDPERRILYRASVLAEKFHCATNKVGMYLARRRHGSEGLYQATYFRAKPAGRTGLKAGGYFLSLSLCQSFEKHFGAQSSRRRRLQQSDLMAQILSMGLMPQPATPSGSQPQSGQHTPTQASVTVEQSQSQSQSQQSLQQPTMANVAHHPSPLPLSQYSLFHSHSQSQRIESQQLAPLATAGSLPMTGDSLSHHQQMQQLHQMQLANEQELMARIQAAQQIQQAMLLNAMQSQGLTMSLPSRPPSAPTHQHSMSAVPVLPLGSHPLAVLSPHPAANYSMMPTASQATQQQRNMAFLQSSVQQPPPSSFTPPLQSLAPLHPSTQSQQQQQQQQAAMHAAFGFRRSQQSPQRPDLSLPLTGSARMSPSSLVHTPNPFGVMDPRQFLAFQSAVQSPTAPSQLPPVSASSSAPPTPHTRQHPHH